MSKKILSCAVAAYNKENVIDKCLNSFIDNRLSEDIEVIIINDGSKDNTASIVEDYVKKYPDIFILVNKENGGYGSTYNVAFSRAIGKYYKVIDGDDWVDTEGLVKLVTYLKESDVDMIYTNCLTVDEQHPEEPKEMTEDLKQFQEGYVYEWNDVCAKVNAIGMHFITVKTSIIKDNHLKIDNGFYTDVEYTIFVQAYAKTCVFFDMPVYAYRANQAEQSISINGQKKNGRQYVPVLLSILDFYKENIRNTNSNYVVTAKKSILGITCMTYIWSYIMQKPTVELKKEFISFNSTLKREYREIFEGLPFYLRIIGNFPFLYNNILKAMCEFIMNIYVKLRK